MSFNGLWPSVDSIAELALPSLTFQLAMFPSVIVGDMAGIVRFCAASDLEALRKPITEVSRLSDRCSRRRAVRQVDEPRKGPLQGSDRLESLTALLHAVASEAISLSKISRASSSSQKYCHCTRLSSRLLGLRCPILAGPIPAICSVGGFNRRQHLREIQHSLTSLKVYVHVTSYSKARAIGCARAYWLP